MLVLILHLIIFTYISDTSLTFILSKYMILGISKLKWTGMGEFNSDDHYYCGQESLRRNGVAIMVNKESEMQYVDAISKTTE